MGPCILIGGFFQLVVQFCLGCVCITTLIIKRHTEQPQRPVAVWILDVLKQSIGALLGHFSNIGLSIIINSSIVNGTSDECLWYCLSFIVDCSLGTAISLLLLYCFERLFSTKMGEYGFNSANPSLFIWSYQLIVWLIIIIISKIIIVMFLLHSSKNLDNILGKLFSPIQQYPNFELVVVMIIVPFVLNIMQFWVQDNFLKGKVNRYSHTQVLQLDLDEELIPSIEMQSQNISKNSNNNIGSSSPKRFTYGPVKTMLSKFNMNAQKLIFPKRNSSGDLQQMDP